jgi:hypothetical protein
MSNSVENGTASRSLDGLDVIQYSDGMYIFANEAVNILRRDLRKALGLSVLPPHAPIDHMELLLVFMVCHKTYNGGTMKCEARRSRCLSDIEYLRKEEGLPDYVLRALQVGIDPASLTREIAETYAFVTELSKQAIPEGSTLTLERYKLPAA